jgi:hypothetical protein
MNYIVKEAAVTDLPSKTVDIKDDSKTTHQSLSIRTEGTEEDFPRRLSLQ